MTDRPPTAPPAHVVARRWAMAAMLAFVAAVHVAWWAVGDTAVHHGNLVDSDGYTWLSRVERLLQTGGWFDSSLPRANAPDGGSLHWTRPFDLLLIGLALPLMPLLGVKGALYGSGVVIAPLLHLGAAAALAWAAAPLVGRATAVIAGALTAAQFAIVSYAVVGRADHHLLQALIAVVAFGFTVRAFAGGGEGNRAATAAGAALAVGVWVGVEGLVLAALCAAAMGVAWVVAGGDAAARNRGLAVGFAGGVAAALLIERGPAGMLAVEYDRISVVHLFEATLVLAFWSAVAWLGRRGRGPRQMTARLLAAVGGAAVGLAVLRLLFPRALANPITDFDPEFLAIFLGTAELARIDNAWHFLLYVGAAALALPWGVRRLGRAWRGDGRWPWLLLVGVAAVYTALTMSWLRWSLFADLFLAVILADLMVAAEAAVDRRLRQPVRAAVKVAALALIAVGPLAVGGAGVYAAMPAARPAPPAVADDPRPCPLQPLARVLSAPPWGDRPRTILASANFGAELLYRTRHRVTATVYHRDRGGAVDGIRILRAAADVDARELLRRRQVDLILICRFGHEGYARAGDNDRVLYRRLEAGATPAWLAAVPLPAPLRQRLMLFRVVDGR